MSGHSLIVSINRVIAGSARRGVGSISSIQGRWCHGRMSRCSQCRQAENCRSPVGVRRCSSPSPLLSLHWLFLQSRGRMGGWTRDAAGDNGDESAPQALAATNAAEAAALLALLFAWAARRASKDWAIALFSIVHGIWLTGKAADGRVVCNGVQQLSLSWGSHVDTTGHSDMAGGGGECEISLTPDVLLPRTMDRKLIVRRGLYDLIRYCVRGGSEQYYLPLRLI